MVEDEVVRDSWEKWDELDMDRGWTPRPLEAPLVDELVVWIEEDEDGFLMCDRRRETVGSGRAAREAGEGRERQAHPERREPATQSYSRRKGGLLADCSLDVEDEACEPEGDAAPYEVGEKEAEKPTRSRDELDGVQSERPSSLCTIRVRKIQGQIESELSAEGSPDQ